jgi:hypothetical protein
MTKGTKGKIEAGIVLSVIITSAAAIILLLTTGCSHDRPPYKPLSVNQPIFSEVTWPQRWTNAEFDHYSRVIGSSSDYPNSMTLTMWQDMSSYSVAQFQVKSPANRPFNAPADWQPQTFNVRAVYRGGGMARIPALGDTLYGLVAWYDNADSVFGTLLPDSLWPVDGLMRAYPRRLEYEGGGATVMMVDCELWTNGVKWTQSRIMAHEDSVWVWQ